VIVLLMMVVLMTIGLSVAQQSSQRLSTATLEEESTQILNAAEAGIEQALSQELTVGDGTLPDGTFTDIDVSYSVRALDQLRTRVSEGDTLEIDTSGVTDSHSLVLNWSWENGCGEDPASLIIATYFDDAGTTRVRYDAIGSCDRSDDFTLASNSGYEQYNYEYSHALQTDDLFVRVQPVYNDTHIAVRDQGPTWSLPEQFYRIRAQATRQGTGETRAVEVVRTAPRLPSVFDFAVYSGTDIIK
jgi:hypothetical protein